MLCDEFQLFDEENNFNHKAFAASVDRLFQTQESLLIILNTPGAQPDRIQPFLGGLGSCVGDDKETCKRGKENPAARRYCLH